MSRLCWRRERLTLEAGSELRRLGGQAYGFVTHPNRGPQALELVIRSLENAISQPERLPLRQNRHDRLCNCKAWSVPLLAAAC